MDAVEIFKLSFQNKGPQGTDLILDRSYYWSILVSFTSLYFLNPVYMYSTLFITVKSIIMKLQPRLGQ